VTAYQGGKRIEEVENSCYLGSVITDMGGSEKDIITRVGKANSVFGRLENIWKNKRLDTKTKMRSYEVMYEPKHGT